MLRLEQFTRVGHSGLGNPRSKNAQSIAFFGGRLCLGVTHHSGEGPEDCARILQYDPPTNKWEVVYKSPLVKADRRAHATHNYLFEAIRRQRGRPVHDEVPLYRGYRGMVVFKGKSDAKPALYVGTVSHWGAQILRSADGEHFEAVGEPGLGSPNVLSFRSMVEFSGRLFVAETGSINGDLLDRNFGAATSIHVSDDPASGRWELAMIPGFGDANNKAAFNIAVFNGYLYVGTGNPETGFQIWRTKAEGKAPFFWEPVMKNGAFRYNLNEATVSMVVFKDALYIGSGIPGLGYDKTHNVGPGAAELIRINRDGSWDIVVGTRRFTPFGLKLPLSGMAPGFNDLDNTVFWSMAVHEDSLYVGTNNICAWRVVLRGGMRMEGGAQLWATNNGEDWQPVTLDGFGNPFATGFRSMLSTPFGFFVGTSNHGELEKVWYRQVGERGNPRAGGTEIWLGK